LASGRQDHGEQALHVAASLVRREPNRARLALTVLADKVRKLA
jgi:hypothetical protein